MKLWHNGRGWQLVLLLLLMATVGTTMALNLRSKTAFEGTLINTYGHFPVARTSWTIDVSPYGITADVKTSQNTELKNAPPDWIPHPGWFVFAEDSKAWAYDGADMVWVEVATPINFSAYSFKPRRDAADTWGSLPNPPKEVYDRLPPKIQAAIRQKFPEGH